MIIVSVKLVSAISPDRDKELARCVIYNTGGSSDGKRGSYNTLTYRGRSKKQLDASMRKARYNVNDPAITRHGRVENYPCLSKHVWNLVARCLNNMGYK